MAQQLVASGKSVELDVWDWAAGTSFIAATRMALDKAARMVALWSPDYFSRTWAQFEHDAAVAKMQEERGWLVPVLIRPCEYERIPAALRPLIYVELVDLSELEARRRLLGALDGPRRPTGPVAFPGRHRPVPFPGGLPRIWNVPARNPFFTGRQGLLAALRERVSAQPVLLQGVGGVGKSQLANEYAWAHAGEHDLVWWVDAESPAGTEAGLLELAAALGTPMIGGAKVVLSQLRAELRSRSGWLLVLDNLAAPDVLTRLDLPGTGRILATTRSADEEPHRLPVDAFTRDESVELLQRRCPGVGEADANRLASVLSDLPLAVGQAAAFLATTSSTVESYLSRLPAPDSSSEAGLAATVRTGLTELAVVDPAALDLLHQLALLAPEPIPLTAAGPGRRPAPGLVVADPATTTELVGAITGLGLAIQDGTRLLIHRRLRVHITENLVPARRRKALGRVLRLLAGADPAGPSDVANWPIYAELLPHVQAADAECERDPAVLVPSGFVRLVDRTCEYLRFSGQPRVGHQLADGVHARRRRLLGADHRDTLTAADNLAALCYDLGDNERSRRLNLDTLTRRRRTLGNDHPDTFTSANGLVVALFGLGEYRTARSLCQETFEQCRGVLGLKHFNSLWAAINWINTLTGLADFEEARELGEEIVGLCSQSRGADEPDTLWAVHTLANTLTAMGRPAEARDLARDTLERRRRVLGADHPDTLKSAAGLASARAGLGALEPARELGQEVFERRLRLLGADHPSTLNSASLLVHLRCELGELEAARELGQDTLERWRRSLGPDHPATLTATQGLAEVLDKLGEPERARALWRDTLQRRRRVLGEDHPLTRRTAGTLG